MLSSFYHSYNFTKWFNFDVNSRSYPFSSIKISWLQLCTWIFGALSEVGWFHIVIFRDFVKIYLSWTSYMKSKWLGAIFIKFSLHLALDVFMCFLHGIQSSHYFGIWLSASNQFEENQNFESADRRTNEHECIFGVIRKKIKIILRMNRLYFFV